jgi:asparaginyl-tRNA synthetase
MNNHPYVGVVAPRTWGKPSEHFTSAIESDWYIGLTRIYADIVRSTFDFYEGREILPVLMPVTVGSVSSPMGRGSDSLPVKIDLMGTPTYLADSMQFQLEFMLRHGLAGAYYIMPTFRGEAADETHLNQFFHSEAEIVGGLEAVMNLVESYVSTLAMSLLNSKEADQFEQMAGSLDHVVRLTKRGEIPRVTFQEARRQLGESAFRELEPGIPGITRAGELRLIEKYGGAVWLSHPPSLSVPFYQRIDTNGNAECADLLLGIGEVVGCGARHRDGADVREALRAHMVDEREYEWYVRMKDEYPMETAGFGLGIERFVAWALRHDDVRDLHVMPRIRGVESWV